ncbi:anti-sigma factor [soil metagenome]
MNLNDPHEMSAIAGEYVLGTLDDDEHGEVARALPGNPALAAEVAAWQDRLLGLTGRVAPLDPSSALWSRIDASLTSLTGLQTDPAAQPDAILRDPQIAANEPFWRRIRVWQGLSALAVAACLVMATMLTANRAIEPPTRYIAVLQTPDKVPGWLVETSTSGNLKLVPLTVDTTVPEGKSLQFWTKIDGAAGPTSLGIVRAGQAMEVDLARLPGVANNQLFEITLEPPNGSPLNRPTGPILFIGRSVKV